MGVTVGNPALASNMEIVWKLRPRVRPSDDAAFDVDAKARFPQLSAPRRAATLGVLYDPSDQSKVVMDRSPGGAAQSAVNAALAGNPAAAANPAIWAAPSVT